MNNYVLIAIAIFGYIFLGLIFMGLESRWKVWCYMAAIFGESPQKMTYWDRLSIERLRPQNLNRPVKFGFFSAEYGYTATMASVFSNFFSQNPHCNVKKILPTPLLQIMQLGSFSFISKYLISNY
jgi:hypothetical protein